MSNNMWFDKKTANRILHSAAEEPHKYPSMLSTWQNGLRFLIEACQLNGISIIFEWRSGSYTIPHSDNPEEVHSDKERCGCSIQVGRYGHVGMFENPEQAVYQGIKYLWEEYVKEKS